MDEGSYVTMFIGHKTVKTIDEGGVEQNTPEIYQFLAFLMCAGLCFVGVAPNFKNGLDRPIHIAGASIAGLCSQIWTTLEEPFALFMWLAWILYIGISIKKNWKGDLISCFVKCKPLFWAEVIAFAIVYFTLFFIYLLKQVNV